MKWVSFVILICLLAACRSPNKIPNDIIGIDKMKFIVWDMIRAGALAENQYGKDTGKAKLKSSDMLKFKNVELFQQVFIVHKISKDQFYKSYRYYEEHADKNKILMDSVSAYANRQRQELYKRLH